MSANPTTPKAVSFRPKSQQTGTIGTVPPAAIVGTAAILLPPLEVQARGEVRGVTLDEIAEILRLFRKHHTIILALFLLAYAKEDLPVKELFKRLDAKKIPPPKPKKGQWVTWSKMLEEVGQDAYGRVNDVKTQIRHLLENRCQSG